MNDIFTERFREALKSCGLSQTQIADKVNITKQCVTDYKTGKSFPSIQTLRKLCQTLDVSADYLLGLSDI